mgnify:CR=1 FL=1
MSGLAQLSLYFGYKVSGSDRAYNNKQEPYSKLQYIGVKIISLNKYSQSEKIDIIVYSTAIESNHPELIYSKEKKIKCYHRAQFLNYLIPNDATLIAVAGTAGKSTTVGLLGLIYEEAKLNPTVYNGASVLNWINKTEIGNVRLGDKKLWIIEVDESDKSLLQFNPTHSLLTNIGKDHYNISKLIGIFDQFKKQTKRKFIDFSKLNCSSHNVPKNNLIGVHNETNVRNAVYFSKKMNIPEKNINEAVFKFKGIERRLQKLGSFKGMDVYDDYAHSPMKINASINAIYGCYPNHNIILLWRPHGYSTLNEHFTDYIDLFNKFIEKKNNLLILMPVFYPGGTVNIIKTTEDLIKSLNNTNDSSKLLTTFNDIYLNLCKTADSRKVLLGMGARDPDLPIFLRRIVK